MANVPNYSQEEISNKHLEALKRKQQYQLKRVSECSVGFSPAPKRPYTPNNTTDTVVTLKSNNSLVKPKHVEKKAINKYTPKEPVIPPKMPNNFFGNNSTTTTAKCYMISNEKFAVELSSYLSSVIDIFKTMDSRSYDIKTKIWSFHLKDYDNLLKKLRDCKPNLSIITIPASVINLFKKNYYSFNMISPVDLFSIDETLRSKLMPFQQEGICFGISTKGRCIIADDMGLGKTIQALGIAHYFKESWPLLIVTPSTVRYQWTDAIYDYLPSVSAHYIHQFTNVKDFNDHYKIVIVSYDLLAKSQDLFRRYGFGFVILDESHIIRNNKTSRFKGVQAITSNLRHIVLLSGTPALSRPIELYTQINLVIPNFMGFQEYGIRYCAGNKKPYGWDFTGSSNMQELQLLLNSTCMIRRLKADVLNQLPSKTRQVIMLNTVSVNKDEEETRDTYKNLNSKLSRGLKDHNALLHYYNESSFSRVKPVCDYVTKLFSTRIKCLVFAHHQHVLDALCEVAQTMKIRYIRIDGTVNPTKRAQAVDNFQSDDNCLVAILSITAANAGITLTAARLVVFAELFWNPGILFQAEDRVHRIGQNKSVTIQYLVVKKTADDQLWLLLKKKINTLNEVGLNQNNSLDELEVTDLMLETSQLRIDNFFKKAYNNSLKSNEPENKEEETSINNMKELLNLDNEDLEDSFTLKVWDYGWLAGYVLYLIMFIILPTKATIDELLPVASSAIILTEQVRMLMKSYAFIRSTTPQFLKYKIHSDTLKPQLPDFSKYFYFLFAPTLIYRDHYPRTKCIRWKFVLWHYLEVLLIIFYMAFIYERCFMPMYEKHGMKPIRKEELFANIINTSLPGILFFLCGFYCLLHAWLNACAELLRFADRLFYKLSSRCMFGLNIDQVNYEQWMLGKPKELPLLTNYQPTIMFYEGKYFTDKEP
ncbi:hypothetical protein M0802_008035 [Mischocyttarus mexicanus]|nr:hypothetical protein M0802_008035 [Mischocyttarus mexicanus]